MALLPSVQIIPSIRSSSFIFSPLTGTTNRRFPPRDKRETAIVMASGKDKKGVSFGDQLLDYIEGGPKLRRWYGAPDQVPREKGDPSASQDPEPEEKEILEDRDSVLVTDGDSDTGQLIILALILRRLKVKALVKDAKSATAGFGPYIEPVQGDVSDVSSVDQSLRGVRAIIVPTKLGVVAARAKLKGGIQHIVLLSQAASSSGGLLSSVFGGSGISSAEKVQNEVRDSGIPYSIVKAGRLLDEPGGEPVSFSQAGGDSGAVSREDVAEVLVRALEAVPQRGLEFGVSVDSSGSSIDWAEKFNSLVEGGQP